MKRCRHCKKPFEPRFLSTETCCSTEHAIAYARESAPERKQRIAKRIAVAERRERRDEIKSRKDWMREAQAVFNAWVRERDLGLPCISCGRDTGAKRNAGHYLSVGSHPELRFEPQNCHSQCEHCNSWKSGNQAEYRPRLIEKIGLQQVEWLESYHEPLKPSVEWLREKMREWRADTRRMRERRGARQAA